MSQQTAIRSFSKKEAKCPKCGHKGAMDLVEGSKGKYPTWFHIVALCTCGFLYLFWHPSKGGVKVQCPSCGNLFA